MIVINNLKKIPEDCTSCPCCNEYDECCLLPWSLSGWDEQYEMCPLEEVEE